MRPAGGAKGGSAAGAVLKTAAVCSSAESLPLGEVGAVPPAASGNVRFI